MTYLALTETKDLLCTHKSHTSIISLRDSQNLNPPGWRGTGYGESTLPYKAHKWSGMKFCDKCGSYMKKTKNGFLCRRCNNLIPVKVGKQKEDMRKTERSGSIYIVNSLEDEYVRVSQVCPKCGNGKAFRWFSRVSGEHAGIRRERTIEHFKCTKCLHSWSKAS